MIQRVFVGVAMAVGMVIVVGLASSARAQPGPAGDAVALLPLDAERSLEIYGQPVASELARALAADHVPVVVVGPRMAVPERARLIVDGTIALGKAGAVTLSLRVRNTLDGVVLETLTATAPALGKIDRAAEELSARILPLVRARLAALDGRASVAGWQRGSSERPPAPAPASREQVVLVAVSDARSGAKQPALSGVFDAALATWGRAHQRTLRTLDTAKLDRKHAAAAVASEGADAAIAIAILDYAGEAQPVPMARARVRVQVSDAREVVFDRVVATDTVVGERGAPPPELAMRVAREVLAIIRPHLRGSVLAW